MIGILLMIAISAAGAEVSVGPDARVRLVVDYPNASILVRSGNDARIVAKATTEFGALPVAIERDSGGITRVSVAVRGAPKSRLPEARIEVVIPRDARFEPIDVGSQSLHVDDLSGGVDIRSGSNVVRVTRVRGDIAVRKASGKLEIADAGSDVSLQMDSGNIIVRRVGGALEVVTGTANLDAAEIDRDVRVVSINGRTTVGCTSGNVTVTDTNGAIDLHEVGGDVMVRTTSGRAKYAGAPRPDRRYVMKTLSGALTVIVPPSADAAVTLSTHAGHIDADIVGAKRETDQRGRVRRISVPRRGRAAVIELDTFEGRAHVQVSPSIKRSCAARR